MIPRPRFSIIKLKPGPEVAVMALTPPHEAPSTEIMEASSQNVRVIGLSLADNELSVFYHEQRTVGQAEDLLRLILDDSS